MKHILITAIVFALGSVAQAEPTKLIFDTDMGNDVDFIVPLESIAGERGCARPEKEHEESRETPSGAHEGESSL